MSAAARATSLGTLRLRPIPPDVTLKARIRSIERFDNTARYSQKLFAVVAVLLNLDGSDPNLTNRSRSG
jgi:hypothetical protein